MASRSRCRLDLGVRNNPAGLALAREAGDALTESWLTSDGRPSVELGEQPSEESSQVSLAVLSWSRGRISVAGSPDPQAGALLRMSVSA